MRTEKCLVVISRDETDFLAVHFIRHLQAERARDVADLRLRHPAEWSERATELRLAQAEEEIGLILARVTPFAQDRAVGVVLDDRVMAGGDVIAAERLRLVPKIAELQLLVAHHARVRRPAGLVFAREIIDHELLELIRFIDHVMRNT